MFTTGSKLFLGASVLAFAGTLIYAVGESDASAGTVGLIAATIALVFLTGINFWVRDGNVSATDPAALEAAAAASPAPVRSMWPIVAAFGVALLAVGLVIGYAITWAAIIIVLMSTVEWMVQAWSERASADPEYNEGVRRRIMNPLELPVLGALGLGLIIFSFSRIMLWLPAAAATIAFALIGLAVLGFGALVALKRNVARSLVVVLCTLGGVSMIGAGVAAAVAGPREVEPHELPSYQEGTCDAAESEADHKSSEELAAKAALAAQIILEGGVLRAEVIGVEGNPDPVTLPRSGDSFIQFKNLDEGEPRRLLVDLGVEVLDSGTDRERAVEDITCTQAVETGGSQFIVVKPPRPSRSSDDPFSFSVPGVDTAVLEIEVP